MRKGLLYKQRWGTVTPREGREGTGACTTAMAASWACRACSRVDILHLPIFPCRLAAAAHVAVPHILGQRKVVNLLNCQAHQAKGVYYGVLPHWRLCSSKRGTAAGVEAAGGPAAVCRARAVQQKDTAGMAVLGRWELSRRVNPWS